MRVVPLKRAQGAEHSGALPQEILRFFGVPMCSKKLEIGGIITMVMWIYDDCNHYHHHPNPFYRNTTIFTLRLDTAGEIPAE